MIIWKLCPIPLAMTDSRGDKTMGAARKNSGQTGLSDLGSLDVVFGRKSVTNKICNLQLQLLLTTETHNCNCELFKEQELP